jgi:hypothetical protein
MNIKKVCIGLALMLPMICAPDALAQSCGGNNYNGPGNWQSSQGYGNGMRGNGMRGNSMQSNNWQRKMQRKMARRAWKQRQLAMNDPNYNYWNQNPGQFQSLWRSQQDMGDLLNGGIISPQEKAMLEAQLAASQNGGAIIPAGGIYNDPYNPYGYVSANNGMLGNLGAGLGNGGNPFINAAMPALLQRLQGYWGGNGQVQGF